MKKSLVAFLFPCIVLANEGEIENLLTSIEKKTDLSTKTKLENGGISFIYTRDDLNRMQAKYLKDVLKSTQPFGYNENRFGLPDPMNNGLPFPFITSNFRIFIDNQEISTSLYGSGLIFLGDIDIGFVDHIEVYSQNPSFEFCTEPTFLLVKLFSKRAIKDEGQKIEINKSSYGSTKVNYQDSSLINDKWSYFTYISKNKDNRKKYNQSTSTLSRDKQVTHLFGSFYNDNKSILIDVTKSNRKSFIDHSLDATPLDGNINYDNLHLGYDVKYDDFSILSSYGYMKTYTDFKDDINNIRSQYSKTKGEVFTNEFKYNINSSNNKLISGLKHRYKKFKYKNLIVNNKSLPSSGHTYQDIRSIFLENQYSVKSNSIITTGIEYSKVKNNNSIQKEELLLYRLGHTYTTYYFTFKTTHTHIETSLEPYLVNSYNYYITQGKKKPQEIDSILENIIWEDNTNKYEFIANYVKLKNFLYPNSSGLLENYEKKMTLTGGNFMWTHNYNEYDKLFISASYFDIKNMPASYSNASTFSIRSLNTYKNFDIFNEVLAYEDNGFKKRYYDYSLGVKYSYSNDLSFSLKGENILNKASPSRYTVINPLTAQVKEPLSIPSIDRKITLTMEYWF